MTQHAHLCIDGRKLDIEYCFVGPDQPETPWIIFLHEGLGSIAMWRDFPHRLCEALGVRGLLYSRPGYGRSTPRATDEHWGVRFMHQQATQVLPALLDALQAPQQYYLFGHSDGASIALIHAASATDRVAGTTVLAPHLFVEDICIQSIEAIRKVYLETNLKERLARYHDDVDSAFWGWNDIWLNLDFRHWTIQDLLPSIQCRVLAVQGHQDEYGTMEQIDAIARALRPGQCELLKLENCRHSAHFDQPQAVIEAVHDSFFSLHDNQLA